MPIMPVRCKQSIESPQRLQKCDRIACASGLCVFQAAPLPLPSCRRRVRVKNNISRHVGLARLFLLQQLAASQQLLISLTWIPQHGFTPHGFAGTIHPRGAIAAAQRQSAFTIRLFEVASAATQLGEPSPQPFVYASRRSTVVAGSVETHRQ